jgi:hypothetical protein
MRKRISVSMITLCLLKYFRCDWCTLTASWAYKVNESNAIIIYGKRCVLKMIQIILIATYTDGSKVNYELGKIQTNKEGQQTSTVA